MGVDRRDDMTIDEAITHCEEIANSKCNNCGAEHKQLAEWLKDYKRLLEQEPCEDCIPREYVIALLENKKRTRKEITNRIYEYVKGVSE